MPEAVSNLHPHRRRRRCAGLVAALADVVTTHGGNWEHSQLAELAGTFAGIVVVSCPTTAQPNSAALDQLDGLLKVTAPGSDEPFTDPSARTQRGGARQRPPRHVRDISAVLNRHGVSIDNLSSESRDTPMSGGRLFEAQVLARLMTPIRRHQGRPGAPRHPGTGESPRRRHPLTRPGRFPVRATPWHGCRSCGPPGAADPVGCSRTQSPQWQTGRHRGEEPLTTPLRTGEVGTGRVRAPGWPRSPNASAATPRPA